MKEFKNIFTIQLLLVFTFFVVLSLNLTAQTVIVNGRTYEMIDDKWYQIENGINYEVDNSVITVKYKDEISQEEIDQFQDQQRVQTIRSNMLGFID